MEERQVQARSLDEQIAAAVAAAMRTQTAASSNGASLAGSPEAPAERPTTPQEEDPSWCARHDVTMTWHDGNDRGPGWSSHRLADGRYCKGK